jgi:hypothetical protein
VLGSDGREQIEYDLLITNAFTADATLYSLEVRGGGRGCLSMTGAALNAVTLQLTSSKPTDGRIGRASTVVTQVDIAFPRWARRTVPALLTNQIRYRIPAKAPSRPVTGPRQSRCRLFGRSACAGCARFAPTRNRIGQRQRVLQ